MLRDGCDLPTPHVLTTLLLSAVALVDLVVGLYLVRYSGGAERKRPEAVLLVGVLLVLAAGFPARGGGADALAARGGCSGCLPRGSQPGSSGRPPTPPSVPSPMSSRPSVSADVVPEPVVMLHAGQPLRLGGLTARRWRLRP